MKQNIKSFVVGTQFKNDKGKSIQKEISDYVKEEYDINRFDKNNPYFESEDEIDDVVYQYELEEVNQIFLKPEPTNKYDEKAIAVYHKDIGKVGYIPREDTDKIRKFIKENPDYNLISFLTGGKQKYYDYDEGEVITAKTNYSFNLILESKEEITEIKKEETKNVNIDIEQKDDTKSLNKLTVIILLFLIIPVVITGNFFIIAGYIIFLFYYLNKFKK